MNLGKPLALMSKVISSRCLDHVLRFSQLSGFSAISWISTADTLTPQLSQDQRSDGNSAAPQTRRSNSLSLPPGGARQSWSSSGSCSADPGVAGGASNQLDP